MNTNVCTKVSALTWIVSGVLLFSALPSPVAGAVGPAEPGRTEVAALDSRPAVREANLLGYVRALDNQRAIQGATVLLESTNTVAITNELGFFTFTNVPVGVHFLRIEAPGFEERRMQVRLTEDQSYETFIEMGPEPLELQGLRVEVMPRRTFNQLRDLDIRMERGFGDFILREEMEERGGNLMTLIQGRPGVRIQGGGGQMSDRTVVLRRAQHITSSTPGSVELSACYPAVFVDGRRFSRRSSLGDQPTDLTEFLAADMDAVEVYAGSSVPAIIGGGDAACGAILIWSRRGPARAGSNR